MSKLNRRDFLKLASLATPLVGLAGMDLSDMGTPTHASPAANGSAAAVPASPATAAQAAPATNRNLGQQWFSNMRGFPKIEKKVSPDGPAPNIMDHQPTRVESSDGRLDYPLVINYADVEIYEGLTLKLRTYNGEIPPATWVVRPGDILEVQNINQLPNISEPPHHDINHPHGFNVLNLHTHGLHVSPEGEQDNVLVEVHPGETFHNRYYISEDHASGLFWYHPHKHGAAAVHMASGMTGNLIVQGGKDDLRLIPEIAAATEVELIFNEFIVYKEELPNANEVPSNVEVAMGEGKINAFWTLNGLPCQYVASTSVNIPMPEIRLRPGEVQHWRLTQAAILQFLKLQLVAGANNEATEQTGLDIHVVAYDGLTVVNIETVQEVDFPPGGRLDLLIKIDEPGNYTFRGKEYNQLTGFFSQSAPPFPLLNVIVEGDPMDMALPTTLIPEPPHIQESEIVKHRRIEFNVTGEFVPEDTREFFVNHQKFNPNIVNHTMLLGTAEEWTIWSDEKQDHPFHIHVNEFELIQEHGQVLATPRRMDTINVRAGEEVVIRHCFKDFVGKSVFHCHLIPHEDHGMMAIIEIVDPNPVSVPITSAGGGYLISNDGAERVIVKFPAQAFSANTEASYQHLLPPGSDYQNIENLTVSEAPAVPSGKVGLERFFELSAGSTLNRAATIEVRYLNPNIELITETARLYRWNGTEWSTTGINVLARTATSISCTIQQLGKFAVLYDEKYIYLPFISHDSSSTQ